MKAKIKIATDVLVLYMTKLRWWIAYNLECFIFTTQNWVWKKCLLWWLLCLLNRNETKIQNLCLFLYDSVFLVILLPLLMLQNPNLCDERNIPVIVQLLLQSHTHTNKIRCSKNASLRCCTFVCLIGICIVHMLCFVYVPCHTVEDYHIGNCIKNSPNFLFIVINFDS